MTTKTEPVKGWQKWFPHPLVSAVVFLSWLVLVGSIAFGSILMGAILGILLPRLTQSYWRYPVTIRSWPKLINFAFLVIWDIVISNLQAVLLLLKSPQELRPAFYVIHLEITDPIAITVLANTITLTPGTVSADISSRHERLLIHGLHVPDVDDAIKTIKERYEAPLKEIF